MIKANLPICVIRWCGFVKKKRKKKNLLATTTVPEERRIPLSGLICPQSAKKKSCADVVIGSKMFERQYIEHSFRML